MQGVAPVVTSSRRLFTGKLTSLLTVFPSHRRVGGRLDEAKPPYRAMVRWPMGVDGTSVGFSRDATVRRARGGGGVPASSHLPSRRRGFASLSEALRGGRSPPPPTHPPPAARARPPPIRSGGLARAHAASVPAVLYTWGTRRAPLATSCNGGVGWQCLGGAGRGGGGGRRRPAYKRLLGIHGRRLDPPLVDGRDGGTGREDKKRETEKRKTGVSLGASSWKRRSAGPRYPPPQGRFE